MKTLTRWTSALVAALVPVAAASAQAPQYTAELLGPGILVNDMNAHGQVVGWTVTGAVRAFLAGPGGQYELLPLPTGYASAWAQGINDAGVVVGSTSTGSFPEFGEACAWFPDGQGGYTTQIYSPLPGHTQSVAYAINNRGDIIGSSITPGFQGGPTVWFNSPTGTMDLASLGAPSSPKQINELGVIVGISGPLFDLDTLSVIPLPPLTGSFTGFQGWAINDQNELAGTGRHGSFRSAATWTSDGGWQTISLIVDASAPVQAFDINGAGVATAEVPTPSAWFAGVGTVPLAALIVPGQSFSFGVSLGSAVNENGQIATIGTDGSTGMSGVVLLTPAADPPTTYCTGKVNSLGCVPFVATNGVASASSTSPFQISANDLVPGDAGILLYGFQKANLNFHGGKLCIKAPIIRVLPPKIASAVLPPPCTGRIQRNFNNVIQNGSDALLTVGQVVRAQLLQRDPADPAGFGDSLTNAVQFTIAP